MLGRKERSQLELFISGSLRQLIPDDHVLVRVERVLDLSWLRDEVADCYCLEDGRPGIDPEAAVRLMLAGLLSGIVHDRRLMREAQVNLAIRWFAGYALHEKLPDHSSLTRIRQRWGPERFKAVLSRTVKACIAARIATDEVVHLDATLIRPNVSWDAIVEAHADAVLTELDSTPAPLPEVATTSKTQRICQTDPDASLAKGGRLPRVEPAYKQQTAVDTKQGVILDVEVTTGGVHDSNTLSALDEVPRVTGRSITIVTLDAGYGVARVFAELEARRIEAIVPTRREPSPKKGVIPARRFKLDARHDRLRCPPRPASCAAQQTKCGGLQSLSLKHSRLPPMSTASGLFQPKRSAPDSPPE